MTDETSMKMKKYAPVVLRIGISFVVLWFGWQQIMSASHWVGLLPQWTASLPFTPTTLIHMNGWFEIITGLMLLLGLYTRIVAFLLTLHLFNIAYTLGYGSIAVRDFGLALSALSIFLEGPSELSLDLRFAKKKM